jgi:AraC-like DNA-binding protein/ligand-binding sensor protein
MVNYDPDHLLELAQAFYTLSGIRMGILDTDASEFFAYPREKSLFCNIVRSHPSINSDCTKCDLVHMQKCKKMNYPITYTCHLGLTEVIAPVKEDDLIICYFMFGQIIIEEYKDQSYAAIYDKIKNEGFEDKDILNAIGSIRTVSGVKLKASVKVLETILSYIFSTKLVTLTKTKFLNRLNAYIDRHIADDIHVSDLSAYINISRTRLYELSKSYLDCGLSEYITNKKILYAKNLLKDTEIKISDLAEKVGFMDYNYFSKVFRKKTGVSPREYRSKLEL